MPRSSALKHHGILLVDKPEGMSSAGLVARIKRLSGGAKVGHAGTLDPFARGLMVCGINHGTRLSRFFLHGDKSYTATITFGSETDTLDLTGTVVSTCDPDFFVQRPDFFSHDHQKDLLDGFTGAQQQVPPVYSALKHQGVPLYKLARKGKPVQKEARSIVIREILLMSMAPPSITVSVHCSSGTYIRSLASDIGKQAGCGAHLSALIRTESCGFTLAQATDLETLAQKDDWSDHLISMDRALPDMAEARVDDSLANKIKNGVILREDDLGMAAPDGVIKLLDREKTIIALVEYDKSRLRYNYCCVFHD